MWTLTWITVAFLLASAGVVALARSTTARWERERRAARARPADAAPPAPRHPVAVRLGRALADAAATARPAAAPVRVLLRTTGRRLAASRQRVAGAVRHVPQVWDARRHPAPGEGVPQERLPEPSAGTAPGTAPGTTPGAGVGAADRPPRRARRGRRVAAVAGGRHGRGPAFPRFPVSFAGWSGHRPGAHEAPQEPDGPSGPVS